MNRHYQNIDDDEDRRIVRDGEFVRVPLHLMDATQRAMHDHFFTMHDGAGNTPGHRPGYVMNDARDDAMRDAKQTAYDEYQRDLCNAWRGTIDARKVTQRDPRGRLLSTFEEIDDALSRDGMTIDQISRDHQQRMSSAYQQYDEQLRNAWRNPR